MNFNSSVVGDGYCRPDDESGDEEEEEVSRILCPLCGKPTTWDPTYQDLCYRCCRADNE